MQCGKDTEIDWMAYMEQVSQYLAGERDYRNIKGGTGPLVYPAGHIYLYSLLYKLTDQGKDIFTGQVVFTGVYMATLAIVLLSYVKAKVPPYILPLLILSKRLHSIYILRLFNDCFTILFLWLAIYLYQSRLWTLGSVLYSLSLSVKMNTLLILPGVVFMLLQAVGRNRAWSQGLIMAQLQILLGWPFITHYPKSYFTKAFEFTRVFLFKWTVNWRFVGEEIFLSKPFAIMLVVAHVCLLLCFAQSRWTTPWRKQTEQEQRKSRGLIEFVKAIVLDGQDELGLWQASQRVTPDYVLTTLLTCNIIGVLCARSLHYQFYSWIAWGTPYLLWRSGWNPVVIYLIWASQEWAWNVYPSTVESSKAVVGALAVTVGGVWWGTKELDGEVDGQRRNSKTTSDGNVKKE